MKSPEGVNPLSDRASTRVMAAGTVVGTISTASANPVGAQEFADVVSKYRANIFRFLLASTRDVELAENLTQDCFLKAHRNWMRFRGESSPMTWLMRIAINVEKDHWRNRRLQFWRKMQTSAVDLDEASEWLPSGERTAEEQMLAKEQLARVWRAVEKLSGRQKTIFLLRYVEDLELADIARATGLSPGTVKAHLSRALSKIRTELGKGSDD